MGDGNAGKQKAGQAGQHDSFGATLVVMAKAKGFRKHCVNVSQR